MSEQERIRIFQKVDVGKLSAWLDLSLDDAGDPSFVKAFKSLLLQRRGKGADELWDLLRRAAIEKESFKEGDKIMQIMQSGTTDCFDLSTEDFEDEPVNYPGLFSCANLENLEGARDEFRKEIQRHIETREGNANLGQVFLLLSHAGFSR
jgi:hypothetical protein